MRTLTRRLPGISIAGAVARLRPRPLGAVLVAPFLGAALALGPAAWASEDEHAQHHAKGKPELAAAAHGAAGTSPSPMQEMGEMMSGMEGGRRSEIYPAMMAAPSLTAAQSSALQQMAEQRLHEGTELLVRSVEQLDEAIRAGDHDRLSSASRGVREALGEIESGASAHALLQGGASPAATATAWYKNAMGLPQPQASRLAPGHLAIMAALAAFLLLAAVAQVRRKRRLAALLRQGVGETVAATVPTAPAAAKQVPVADAAAAVARPDSQGETPVAARSNNWSGPLRVSRIFQENPQVKTFRLVDPECNGLPFDFLPGQFLTVTVTPDARPIKRSYTIASAPTRPYLEVTVRYEAQGVVSGYLHEQVHEGDLVQVTGPSGKFTFAGEDRDSIVLIAGGVGVTPMMSVIRFLTDRSWPGDIFLVYSSKTDADVIFRDELEYLTGRHPNLHLCLIADQATTGWRHATGRINADLLVKHVPGIPGRHIHLCGPKPMMEAVKAMLTELHVPQNQVETEVFIGKEPVRPTASGVAADPAASPAETLNAPLVSFARSGKSAAMRPGETVLDAAEEAGVEIEYSCRAGTCGACKVKLLSGGVTMEVDDALTDEDKAGGLILACQAKATGANLSVEA